MDDFAFKKRLEYGSVMIDHDSHKVLDMISSRKKADVKKWLKKFKNIKIITRDRSNSYGFAITETNDEIIQIADVFHILENITDKGKVYIASRFPKEYDIGKNKKIERKEIENLMYKKSKKEWSPEIQKCLKNFPEIEQFLLQIYKYKNLTKKCDTRKFQKLLENWKNSSISVLKTFTKGIINDYDAVFNSVKYKITNGLAEGTVNKIKVIKRFCYGRAKGELLRKRVFLYDEFQHCE